MDEMCLKYRLLMTKESLKSHLMSTTIAIKSKFINTVYNTLIMKSFLKNSAIIIIVLGLATFLSYLFAYFDFQEATIIIIYMLAVIIVSQTTSTYFYGLAASLISVLAFNFFFTHPLLYFQCFTAGLHLYFLCHVCRQFLIQFFNFETKK